MPPGNEQSEDQQASKENGIIKNKKRALTPLLWDNMLSFNQKVHITNLCDRGSGPLFQTNLNISRIKS